MASLWPWLALAGVGALHGLNPATGWLPAAACGLRAGDARQALRALLPLALGHLSSVLLVAAVVALGLAVDRRLLQGLAAGLLIAVLLVARCRRSAHGRLGSMLAPLKHVGPIGLGLWSFIMATAHGAGLMLVPALIPLCIGDAPARELTASGSLMLALAAVGVHTAAMLLVAGALATGACRGFDAIARRCGGFRARRRSGVGAALDVQAQPARVK